MTGSDVRPTTKHASMYVRMCAHRTFTLYIYWHFMLAMLQVMVANCVTVGRKLIGRCSNCKKHRRDMDKV